VIAALEFAYTEAPFAMQGMVMGMNHVTTGLGALLGSALYNVVALVTAAAGNARNSACIRGFLNDMRYINPRFTYLLTYSL